MTRTHTTTTRRRFLQSTAAFGAAGALPGFPGVWPVFAGHRGPAPKLKILVLGGTGFIGPHIVEYALKRGHKVTLFNRGRTNPHLFPDLEKLRGDRDPEISDGLSSIEAEVESGREWDAIVDTSAYVPRIASASASLLAKCSDRYVIVSSISVYADSSEMGITEESELATMEDETEESMGDGFQNYGPLKALCEKAAATAYDGRATIIRPGFIVGPRDSIPSRFNLWVARISSGGVVQGRRVAPGSPSDPVQYIDARDLGAFMIRCAEDKNFGAFNIIGPRDTLTMKEFFGGIVDGIGSEVEPVWIPSDFLDEYGHGGSFIPWLSPTGDARGYSSVSNKRAVKAGLTFRSITDTARDTHKWFDSLDERDPGKGETLKIMNSGAEEKLLEAWDSRGDG